MRESIRYRSAIGAAEKYERLKFMNTYWTEPFRGQDRVILKTPSDPARHGAIASFGIAGVEPKALGDFLYERYAILTAPIANHPLASGARVTPGLPTPLRHLDRLKEAVVEAVRVL